MLVNHWRIKNIDTSSSILIHPSEAFHHVIMSPQRGGISLPSVRRNSRESDMRRSHGTKFIIDIINDLISQHVDGSLYILGELGIITWILAFIISWREQNQHFLLGI